MSGSTFSSSSIGPSGNGSSETGSFSARVRISSGNRDRVRSEHAQMLDALRRRDVAETVRLHDIHRNHSVAWVSAQLLQQKKETA